MKGVDTIYPFLNRCLLFDPLETGGAELSNNLGSSHERGGHHLSFPLQ